jgi:AAA15 family ATPase/GTPase
MEFISEVRISNFKSVRECVIPNCKRINLFIGRPNVGKSNLLEALSVFSIPYLAENTSRKLTNLIRLENAPELFYNGDTDKDAKVETGIGKCQFGYDSKEGLKFNIDFFDSSYHLKVDEKLIVRQLGKRDFEPPVKKYQFKPSVQYRSSHARYLIPPFGPNLLNIIEEYSELRQFVKDQFSQYGLEIAFDKASHTIKIIQQKQDGLFLIPYNSIADTLQRIIFYKASILSNNNNILLYEEPEAHSFPPYMAHFTQEMIHKRDNQYFIATHSPFILTDLLENAQLELRVYMVDYKDRQTVIKPLTDADMREVFQNSVDLFTNSERYI